MTAQEKSRDRPAANPGGVDCQQCGCIFVGEEYHRFCAVCIEAVKETIVKQQNEPPAALTSKQWLPCPFCGCADIRTTRHPGAGRGEHRGEDVYSMCCYGCGASTPNMYKEYGLDRMREKWNRRAAVETSAPRDEHDFPMDAKVRNIWEHWEGTVVSSVTHYEVELPDGTYKQNVHCRDLEAVGPAPKTGEDR